VEEFDHSLSIRADFKGWLMPQKKKQKQKQRKEKVAAIFTWDGQAFHALWAGLGE
jgi:hypothetical protein